MRALAAVVIICAVNRHRYSTEAECIDKLGSAKTEDRALRRRNSSADFWGRDAAEIGSISAALHPGAKRTISGYGAESPSKDGSFRSPVWPLTAGRSDSRDGGSARPIRHKEL